MAVELSEIPVRCIFVAWISDDWHSSEQRIDPAKSSMIPVKRLVVPVLESLGVEKQKAYIAKEAGERVEDFGRVVTQAQWPTKSGTYPQGHRPPFPIAFSIMTYPFNDWWLPEVQGIPAVWSICHASINRVGWTMRSGGGRLEPMNRSGGEESERTWSWEEFLPWGATAKYLRARTGGDQNVKIIILCLAIKTNRDSSPT
ncbi:hypothetical protein IW261DRAFT_1663717 [Armillaria novae-zelandiae]|uniref:Uncharacterized protein n=1 Tax=Armillaria novae-zelandiae TaxID=153914 RepID=A0AA39PMA3_9AGAR|nr:hypothetical protein IW261DRAFT_1663717 [Armillaria novae-zelandiae]